MGVDLGSRRIDYIAGFIDCRALVLASDEVLQFLDGHFATPSSDNTSDSKPETWISIVKITNSADFVTKR